ncbi:hypothetical protein AAG570_004353 [Ranatra chinensis]|uniref:Iron-sulfur cluster assembly 1 homolog, mitochondrial n=1 Tax=Ranatra chinensis TaxID=642074 RepID=A0ABD0Y2Z9_9HEMI
MRPRLVPTEVERPSSGQWRTCTAVPSRERNNHGRREAVPLPPSAMPTVTGGNGAVTSQRHAHACHLPPIIDHRSKNLPPKGHAHSTCMKILKTQAAVKKIKEIMVAKPDYIGLKVGVRQKGCNGLSYTLDYATEKGKLDEVVNQDGVCVIVDRKAQLTLLGTEMDFVEDKLTSEFVFRNPNIKGTCGCGESFSI